MILIPELKKIVLEYALIKNENDDYLNYCNLCKEYKNERMCCNDLIFYQIKVSFILDTFFINNSIKEIAFEKIINNSSILPEDGMINKYGWVTNSMYIEDYWFSINNIIRIDEMRMLRLDYLDFLNDNFVFLEERCVTICKQCKDEKRKIKID
jgi:hypothetical protein